MLEIHTIQTSSSLIDKLHQDGSVSRDSLFEGMEHNGHGIPDPGGYVVLQSGKQSALALLLGDEAVRVVDRSSVYCGIRPRDKQQLCFIDAIERCNMAVALGGAGTGKTTLAISYAVHQLMNEDRTVVLCKPTRLVGGPSDAWGTLPGGQEEKMQPYMESFIIPLKKILGDTTQMYMDRWINSGKLIVQPLETIRGMSFENCVVLLDEAQNTSVHELLSFISRVAGDSKCIVMGDPHQIDVDVSWKETGLAQLLNSDVWWSSTISAGVKLTAQYRGPLAELAAACLKELHGDEDEDELE